MRHSYLEVTYQKGRAIAAYYYLPRRGHDKSTRTERIDASLLVDFASDGRPIGVEICSPSHFDLSALNAALTRLGRESVRPEEMSPLVTA